MPAWEEIANDPDYRALPPGEQGKVKRAWFRKNVAATPEYQSLPQEGRRVLLGNFLGIDKGPKVDAVANPVEAFGRSFADEAANNTLAGNVARAGKRAVTGDGSEFKTSNPFYTDDPLASAAALGGRFAAQVLDPTNLIPISKGAQAAKAITPLAGASLGGTLKAAGRAAVKGAVPAAASGAIFGGTDSTARQYADTGRVNLGQLAADTAIAGAAGAAMGGIIPAAKALPKSRLNPDLPSPRQVADAVTPDIRRLVTEEAGEFDPSGPIRRLIRNQQQREGRLRQQGQVAEADLVNSNVEAVRDVDTMINQRPEMTGDPNAVVASDHFNFRRLNVSAEVSDRLAQQVREVAVERGYDPKQRIGFDQIRAEAAEIDPSLVSQLRRPKDGETLNPAVRYAAREQLNTINSQIVDLERQIRQEGYTMAPDDLRVLESRQAVLERDAKGLLDVLIPTRSQDGRNLAYHRMIAENSFDNEYWLARATRVSGGNLAPENHNRIREILVRGNQAEGQGDQAAVRQARIELAQAMAKLDRTGALDTIAALRKAGLLTGLKTQARNLSGNLLNNTLEEVTKMPAAIIDMGLSLATGNRTVAMPRAAAIARAGREGAVRGVREWGEIMQRGLADDQLAKLEIPREVNTGSRLLDGYINGVFRLQSGADRPFKIYAFERSLEDQARLAGMSLDTARTDNQMVAQAIADSEFATFQNKTALGEGLSQFKQGLPDYLRLPADLVLPFIKTPTAIASRIMDYAVLGGVTKALVSERSRNTADALVRVRPREAWRAFSAALTPAEQKAVSLGISRGLVGPALIFLGYKMAEAGIASGTYDQKMKDTNEAAGIQSGSIKVGGRWINISPLSPVGNLLTLGATIHRDGASLASVGALAAKTVLDQPFTQGAKEVVDVANDPSKAFGKFVGNTAASFVPSLVNEVGSAFDANRRAVSRELPNAVTEGIQSRLPGARNQLAAKVGPDGQPVDNPYSGLNAFNAFAGSRDKTDESPVLAELVRVKKNLSPPPKSVTLGRAKVTLSPELHRVYQQEVGQMVTQILEPIVADADYQALGDDERSLVIDRVVARAKLAGGRQFKARYLREIQALPTTEGRR